MATIQPFKALRPAPGLAEQICAPPYDVMSTEEARQMAAGNPLNFLHVSRPEIDLPPESDPHDSAVYAQGAENFRRLIGDDHLRQDETPSFYLYRQVMGSHAQVGLVAVASCGEYRRGTIKKHEHTRPEKENDRVRHIEALQAQTGPVFLTYRARPEIDRLVEEKTGFPPAVDFTAPDGIRHSAWIIEDAPSQEFLIHQFAAIPQLYIADGHHRSAAACRVWESGQSGPRSAFFLSVLFPHNQIRILPYNRVLWDWNQFSPGEILAALEHVFTIEPVADAFNPTQKYEIAFYLTRHWHRLRFRDEFRHGDDPAENLDVSLLQKLVLEPLFGIDDPRLSNRISFIGGIRGNQELARRVDAGEFSCAFALYPTGIDDLMNIADANGIMPPKSTWFEPKLRDAMFCHLLE